MIKFCTFLLVLSLVGCADSTLLKPDAPKPIAEKDVPKMLAVSLRHWESLKQKYGDNYKYERIQTIAPWTKLKHSLTNRKWTSRVSRLLRMASRVTRQV